MLIRTIVVQTKGLIISVIFAASTNRRPIKVIIYPG